MDPLIALIAVVSFASLVFGVLWLIGPVKTRDPRERRDYRPTAIHRWGEEERTRELR